MPAVLSKIDIVTKLIVVGWIRIHERDLHLTIPKAIHGICTTYYYLPETFDLENYKDALNGSLLNKMKEDGIIKFSLNNTYVSFIEPIWGGGLATIWGVNKILLNNVFGSYNYYWEFKVHKLETRDLYESRFKIGFKYDNGLNEKTSKYCNEGHLEINYSRKKKYGQSFGRNDLVSASLNTVTMEVRFGVNGCDQGIAFKMNGCTEPATHVKIEIEISGPHVEIEIVKFDRVILT